MKGKTVFITGGGTGIGAATARHFALAGASAIAIIGRRPEPLIETCSALHAEFPNTRVFYASADVTKKNEVEKAFYDFAGENKVDILISNAAVLGAMGPIKDVDPDEWFNAFVVNVKGPFVVAQAFLKYAAKDAIVINVSTAVVHVDSVPNFSSYSTSKSATVRFFGNLQYEHPELRVVHIQPGIVTTDMNRVSGYPGEDDSKY